MRLAPERTVVATCDPATVKDVFTGPPAVLHAGKGNIVLRPFLGSRSVLLLDGAEHMRQRKLLLPPFHGERMRSYGDMMREVAERHLASWPRSGELETAPTMQAITLEVILRAVFGISDRAEVQRWSGPMRETLNTVGNARRILALGVTLRSARLQRAKRGPWARVRAEMRPIDEMILGEARARRAELERGEGVERDDVLSLLLAARDENGKPMTDQELRDELVTLLVAGHETTATALAWTLERVTRTPHVLERLYADGGVDDEDYIDAVCKEALRLRPVVPAAARELQEPLELGGREYPAGVVVAPSIVLMHLREDIYPEPYSFRPERFLERPAGTYEWIPFGGGVRRCLGASFALFEMRAVLQALLQGVRLAPNASKGEGVRRKLVTLIPAHRGRVTLAG
jgi:cytochrome P450